MGTSNRDIALTVIANGESAHFASVKGVGNIIWDTRLGIFSEEVPRACEALAFIAGTDWEHCVEVLDGPLQNAVYGSITINFDSRTVIDANGYGPSDRMFFEWLVQSVHDAANGSDGLIPKSSLLAHFASGRIQLLAGLEPYGEVLRFENLGVATNALAGLKDAAWEVDRKFISFARILMPEGWTLDSCKQDN